MSLKNKLLLIVVGVCVAPALVVGIASYISARKAVEGLVKNAAESRVDLITRRIAASVDAHEKRLAELSREQSLRAYVRDAESTAASSAPTNLPDTVRAHLGNFFRRGNFAALSCVGHDGRPLFRVTGEHGGEPQFQTQDFVAATVKVDERLWREGSAESGAEVRSSIAQESYGPSLKTSVPIPSVEDPARTAGALILELKLAEVMNDAVDLSGGLSDARTSEAIVALDNAAGRVLFHANEALKYQPVAVAMPYFEPVARRMQAGAEGIEIYRTPSQERTIAVFQQVPNLNVSIAVSENYSAAAASVEPASLAAILVPVVTGLVAIGLLLIVARRTTRRIHEVSAFAAAIADGDLDQRIEVASQGETRALAHNFNRMTDRLRDQIRREAESRQFDSFLRLSAMLTHDLKNAITGLSMLVSNMERHLHREDFRADALLSLREATDKLKRIVSRLSEPVKSLSGEYRRDARPTDLIPIIRRVLATNAEPSTPLYELDTRLPESLVAIAEADRMENVIENLVINALEAMGSAGGRLTIEAGRESDNLVFFSVADTGGGMNEEFIKLRLFRPFTTTKQKGIGLGLFTCREVVEAHGGRLEVESKPGVGTRFRVVLPSRLFASGERARRSSEGSTDN